MFYQVERWLSAPRWVRGVVLVIFISTAITLIDRLSIQPLRVLIREYATKNQHESERIEKLRRDVVSLISLTKNEDRPLPVSPPLRFSIMDLVKQSGGSLEKWQPESKPVTLDVLLEWQKLPAIFVYLSSYSNVALHAFSMAPEGEKLKLTVALDITDES